MMTPEIEEHYRKVCQAAFDVVPSDFRKLWVRSEIDDGVSMTGLYYLDPSGRHHFVTEGLYAIDNAMNALHAAVKKAGQPLFSSATVTLDPEGRFSFDYGYDDVSDPAQQFDREDDWIRIHLGKGVDIVYDE